MRRINLPNVVTEEKSLLPLHIVQLKREADRLRDVYRENWERWRVADNKYDAAMLELRETCTHAWGDKKIEGYGRHREALPRL